jgi:hypothetical protein
MQRRLLLGKVNFPTRRRENTAAKAGRASLIMAKSLRKIGKIKKSDKQQFSGDN